MRTTPFYKAAELIQEYFGDEIGCCHALAEADGASWIGSSKSAQYFTELFKPTFKESDIYDTAALYWLGSYTETKEDNENFRILALLLCHEIYLSETK